MRVAVAGALGWDGEAMGGLAVQRDVRIALGWIRMYTCTCFGVRGSQRAQPTGYNLVLPAGELAEWLKAAVC